MKGYAIHHDVSSRWLCISRFKEDCILSFVASNERKLRTASLLKRFFCSNLVHLVRSLVFLGVGMSVNFYRFGEFSDF